MSPLPPATYLVIDESPLLQEGMDPHHCTHIPGKIAATGSGRQILGGIQSKRRYNTSYITSIINTQVRIKITLPGELVSEKRN